VNIAFKYFFAYTLLISQFKIVNDRTKRDTDERSGPDRHN